MVNKQDTYWMECTLDEKVDQKVCEYLREHHAEYRNTKQKMKELMERYPKMQTVFETDDDARQPFLMGYQIHENILGKLQLQKWLYFASRPYTVDAQTEIRIPDKAL